VGKLFGDHDFKRNTQRLFLLKTGDILWIDILSTRLRAWFLSIVIRRISIHQNLIADVFEEVVIFSINCCEEFGFGLGVYGNLILVNQIIIYVFALGFLHESIVPVVDERFFAFNEAQIRGLSSSTLSENGLFLMDTGLRLGHFISFILMTLAEKLVLVDLCSYHRVVFEIICDVIVASLRVLLSLVQPILCI
jgi:hypothetical protein